jgi:sarcosine oxidase
MRVVVIGLGAVGLPAARVLAERGHQVIGLDRHGVASPLGSSAGATRIARVGHPDRSDVRLALRTWDLWRALEERTGATLVDPVGLLVRGEEARGYVEAVRAEGGEAEEVDAAWVADRFPELAPWAVPTAWLPQAGVLYARRALEVQDALARAAGADVSAPECVLEIDVDAEAVRVRTDRRTVEAERVVVAAGPWATTLLPELGLPLPLAPALGQVSFWRGGAWAGRPALIDYPAPGRLGVYGLPTPGAGYKIGIDTGDEDAWNPDAVDWPPDAREEAVNVEWVRAYAPGLAVDGPHMSERCPWTMTPDAGFAVGARGPLVVAAGCSGHAFKFSPLFGELLADLAEGKALWPDALPWSLERFDAGAGFERVETPLGPRIRL